jgi:hypothetical protein
VPLSTDCSKAASSLEITWISEADTYNEMAAAMGALGLSRAVAPSKAAAIAPVGGAAEEEPASPLSPYSPLSPLAMAEADRQAF